ncbi:galactose-1-phosphate uridyl transferase [Suhomyces tanzawaensis NRRL Y-17324]|uniref:Galactose-1-phosphate uridylyltransferase n=1 Tax=Suhomyces tanzawaensis NRRL Y-17324 TaxID=984487 RepID=A0A1E4SJ05_9ASCO|nr:galactose-1-phosphate uridyl transferase [Suhomyces tanzawaensis NRRL Y-17324]ODV79493.1 galactose-1-phosphate uridyl transferase [Suhomyces tanzawaensis NRRL Y-17324]
MRVNRVDYLLNPIPSNQMTQSFDFTNHSHRRHNPLTGSYILCSPHRAKRPWQGAREEIKKMNLPSYDPKCYLCPGNIRATGDRNPKFEATYVFTNDYPAVKLEQPDYVENEPKDTVKGRLLKTEGVKGKCFVICFSPNHNLTLPLMEVAELTKVVDTWQKLYHDLGQEAGHGSPYKYLQLFENKGSAMGCSNPHPHGQAWCLDIVPTEVQHELNNMSRYYRENQTHMLGDYVQLEIKEKERVVVQNDSFLVVVPYWALWPFETLLIAKEHLRSTEDFSDKHKTDLAEILKKLTTKYDNLFNTFFPYSMGIHQAPFQCTDEEKNASWFHMHFYPPLLRSATVKKFCVGFEMLGEAQRDLTSEQAAGRLQDLDGDVHFLNR